MLKIWQKKFHHPRNQFYITLSDTIRQLVVQRDVLWSETCFHGMISNRHDPYQNARKSQIVLRNMLGSFVFYHGTCLQFSKIVLLSGTQETTVYLYFMVVKGSLYF